MWVKGCAEAIKLLDDNGWHQDRNFYWTLPTEDYVPSADEWDAIDYLCECWDFGFFK